ncbi:MAG TPA: hypothetical protein PKL08_00945 [Thermoanaerobaculaceae bacterium]|nr:hypothetical protein [Thermoanaerobaculaceae bacterium]
MGSHRDVWLPWHRIPGRAPEPPRGLVRWGRSQGRVVAMVDREGDVGVAPVAIGAG